MLFGNNKERKDPTNELEMLDQALENLKKRYEDKAITLEEFSKLCEELGKKKEKALKRLEKENN